MRGDGRPTDARQGSAPTGGEGGHGTAAGPFVTARLFAGLEGLARERRAEWRVPVAGAATVTDLCESLGLPAGVAGLVLVNGVHAEAGTPLSDGDEVSLFPPVGGG